MKITPIDGNVETEGAPFVYRGNTLIVARSNNNNFKKVFRDKMKPYENELDNDRVDEETSRKIMIECTAKAILVDWETITDADGNEHDYSFDNAVELLTDDRDCYDAVIAFSSNVENYLRSSIESTKGK